MTNTRSANRLTHWLAATALALGLAPQAAQAAPAWQINTSGQGASGATAVSTVAVGGVGFVEIIPSASNPTGFTFVEHGAYQLLQSSGSAPFGSQDLTVAYSVSGTGSFLNPLALHFTTGSISLYVDTLFDFGSSAGNFGADNGTLLGSFSVIDGGLAPTGLVSVQARLNKGSLLSGYLFDGNGNDLTSADNVLMQLGVFNQVTIPDPLLVSEIVCGLSGSTGDGCNGHSAFTNTPFAYTVRDGGGVALSTVPEPGSIGLLLAGLGLIPVAARRRRLATKQD